jgi:hypothetical protein
MQKAFKKSATLKSGLIIPKGTKATIQMDPNNPMIVHLSGAGFDFKSRSASLHKYFPGFVNPYEIIGDPDEFDSCIVPSLTGEDVEPDGYDDKGFPSVLLALGMI